MRPWQRSTGRMRECLFAVVRECLILRPIGGDDSTAAPAGQERGGNKAPAAAEMLGICGIIDLRAK